MSNRTEVIIDGIRHLMTDEQIGELTVDISPIEMESIRLELARERGEPEPILYPNDEPAAYPVMVDNDVLAIVVELQIRMDKGMALIQDLSAKKKALDEGKAPRILYSKYQELKDRISRYWDHWNMLRMEVQRTVGDNKAIWALYFQIEDKEQWLEEYAAQVINKYFCSGDTTEVDEQQSLHQTQYELMEELLSSDINSREG